MSKPTKPNAPRPQPVRKVIYECPLCGGRVVNITIDLVSDKQCGQCLECGTPI